MKKRPKILLGTPTHEGKEYCLDYWVKVVKKIKKEFNCDIILIDNSKTDRYSREIKKRGIKVIKSPKYNLPLKSLGEARKKLYEYAIKNNYDFLFSLEQDIFPPIDIIKHLLKIRGKVNEESIIGVPYIIYKITYEERPYLTKDRLTNIAKGRMYNKKLRRKIQENLTEKELEKKEKLMKVFACGLGCTFLDVSILKKIKVRYSATNFKPDDAFLFTDCKKQKIPVYIDPKLLGKIIHIEGNSMNVLNWNKKRF